MRMNYQCCTISQQLQDAVEVFFETGCSQYVRCTGQGNDFELTLSWFQWYEWKANIGVPISHEFPRFVIISQILWPKVRSRWRFSRKSWPFWKKTPYGQIFKNVFRKHSWRHRSMYCARISWNLADRKSVDVRYLPDKKKTKFRLALPLWLLCE